MVGDGEGGIGALREVVESTGLNTKWDAENEEDTQFEDDSWFPA